MPESDLLSKLRKNVPCNGADIHEVRVSVAPSSFEYDSSGFQDCAEAFFLAFLHVDSSELVPTLAEKAGASVNRLSVSWWGLRWWTSQAGDRCSSGAPPDVRRRW